MKMKRIVFLTIAAIAATGAFAAAGPPAHEGFGGIWVLNRDRGDAPGVPNAPEAAGPEGGRRGGRFGGRGGFGRRGGSGGRDAGGQEEDLARRQATANYVRTAMEASKQLTIVVHGDSVTVTDAEGRVLSLKTDNKKIEERAENGLVKLSRKARWDGDALVLEVDVENGPSIVRRYELSPGGTQLQISTKAERLRGGTPANLVRLYERPVEPRQ